jgi:dephospho-CoA kinase
MLRVALTGGIGTGKSYVARRLRALGVPVVDADVLAREAVAPGSPALRALAERFGPGVMNEDGTLRRQTLASIVFADAAARADLERIVHPVVVSAIDAFFAAQPPGTPFAVADIPLLFETGRERAFDAVVVAACPPETQVARVMARDGLTEADARGRLAAQLPIADKVARADYVIDTSGSYEQTDATIARVASALRERAAGSQL